MDRIPAIDLEISGACNLRCQGCWGTPRGMEQSHGLGEWFGLLAYLKENAGLRAVTITGGEPTLVKGIGGFIQDISAKLGLEVYLESNGFFLLPLLPEIAPHLTNVSLSLEGSTPGNNSYRRGPDAFGKTLGCLDYLNGNYPQLPVKIGTCVYRRNLADVPDIGDVLLKHGFANRYPSRGVWKLYQATRFGAGKDDAEWKDMEISKPEFMRVARECAKRYDGKISMTAIPSDKTGGYCIIVRPNGNVVANAHTPRGEEQLVFGDIFPDRDGAIRAIKGFQDESHVRNRLVNTYFFRWEKKKKTKLSSPASNG